MGYKRLQGVRGVTRVYRGHKALPGFIILRGGYKWLQKVTWGYNRLQGNFKRLQEVTRGYKRLQKVARDYKKLQGV